MTPDQLITKAIHCLRTGQPNLAKLYLLKAEQLVTADRRQLKHEICELKYRQLDNEGIPFAAFVARVSDQLADLAEALTATFKANMPSLFDPSGYTLAGPAGRP